MGWPELPRQLNFLFYKYLKITFFGQNLQKNKSMGFKTGLKRLKRI
jgi:hypothetical protein